jgi:hypothetical protein
MAKKKKSGKKAVKKTVKKAVKKSAKKTAKKVSKKVAKKVTKKTRPKVKKSPGIGARISNAYHAVVDSVKGTGTLRDKMEKPGTSESE